MKSKKIRRLKFFSTIDVAVITEYLENMAAQGYFFIGQMGCFYTFEKGEPAKRKYHVELFHDGSMFGSKGDNEETKAYAATWEEKGWKYVYANGRQIFFVSEDLDAEPICIEPEAQLRKLRKCINSDIIALPIFVLLCLGNLFTFNNTWPTEFIENSNLNLCWIALMIFACVNILRYIRFYSHNKKRVSSGLEVEYPAGKRGRLSAKMTAVFLIAAIVFLFISLGFESKEVLVIVLINLAICTGIIVLGFKLMHKIGGKRTKVQQIIIVVVTAILTSVITIVISFSAVTLDDGDKTIEYYDEYGNTITETVTHDEIPLTQQELGTDVAGLIQADTCCDKQITIYGNVYDCWQIYYDKYGGISTHLSYNITECRFDWVKDKLIEQYMTTDYLGDDAKFIEATSAEKELWSAEIVYIEVGGYDEGARLVIYDDVICFIDAQMEYTDEVIYRIKTELGDWIK